MGIGTKLTNLMREQNTNANELSIRAKVPAQTIYSLIRRDASKVDIDSLIKISRALGVSAEYFCSDAQDFEPQTIAAHLDTNGLSEEDINDVSQYIEFIKNKRKK